jgi:hypothetical protein
MNQQWSLKYKKPLIELLSLCVLVISLVAVFSNLTSVSERINIFFSSDSLYLPSIYRDVFIDKNEYRGWHLAAAPNFFPDMAFYFLLMFITNNLIISSFVFAVVQCVAIGFLLNKIFQLLFPGRSAYYMLVIYSLLSVFLLEALFFTRDFFYSYYLFVHAFHTAAFVMTLVCFVITIKFISDPKWPWLVLLFVLGFLSIVSDRLFIVLYVVPVCASCAFLFKRITIKTSVLLILTNTLFVALGMWVFRQIDNDSYGFMNETGKVAQLEIVKDQFGLYFGQMKQYLTNFGFRAVTVYVFIISFLALIYLYFHALINRQNPLFVFYLSFAIVLSVCSISAPMLSGKYFSGDCLRYSIYPFYLATLNIALFTAYAVKHFKTRKIGRLGLIGISSLLLITAVSQTKIAGLKDYFTYYPELTQEIDALAEKENLRYGVGGFWEAKKITMFSKKGIKVYAVFDAISIYDHAANVNCYFNNIFNFVVLNDFRDTTLYKQMLKNVRHVNSPGKLNLVKASPFRYDRATGYRVLNIGYKD